MNPAPSRSKHLGAEFDELLRAVRASPAVNADETGWRVSGDNRWLWVFADRMSTVFTIKKSRGGKVIDAVLGEDYDGVITSDFYSAYNKHNAQKSKCWAHLLRKSNELESVPGRHLHKKLSGLFDEITKFNHKERNEKQRMKKYTHLTAEFKKIVSY